MTPQRPHVDPELVGGLRGRRHRRRVAEEPDPDAVRYSGPLAPPL
jgi:hypothetical protein